MSTQPRVSIIIPVFNAGGSLEECLQSATQQTLRDIEIICVDDCSTDASRDIMSKYHETDNRIRAVYHAHNQGEGAARNSGLDIATGEYIFHLDADDSIPADAMKILYAIASTHDSEMVKGRYAHVHTDGTVREQEWSSPNKIVINTDIHASEFLQRIPTSHCTYLYKRSFLNQHNIRYPTDMQVGLDLIALAAALCKASKVTLTPDVIYHYHQTESSITRGQISVQIAMDAIRSKAIVSNMLEEINLYDQAVIRLKKWEYIIDTFWNSMPTDLSQEESQRVFAAFRQLISSYNIIPWRFETPHHYRYILALVVSEDDGQALAFLSTEEAHKGFHDDIKLAKALNEVLSVAPDDTGALEGLGRIARSQGDFEKALDLFTTVIKLDSDNIEAPLQKAGTLIQMNNTQQARELIDTTLGKLVTDLDNGKNIIRLSNLKEHLALAKTNARIASLDNKLKSTREELKSTRNELQFAHKEIDGLKDSVRSLRSELDVVYNSRSWKITAPLRKCMKLITGTASTN